MNASQQPGSHGTCGDDHPPLIGGHVGRRGAVLLVHVAVVIHGVGLASTNQLAAFADAAVHRRLPRWERDKGQEVTVPLWSPQHGARPGQSLRQLELFPSRHLVKNREDAADATLFFF